MAGRTTPTSGGHRAYWVLRIVESVLLLAMVAGIGMFAWSLVDIVRIETAKNATGAMPPTAWPGVFVFGGALVLLQVVRAVLVRYRHEDGTPRGDARDLAAAATADVLAAHDARTNDPQADIESDTGTGV